VSSGSSGGDSAEGTVHAAVQRDLARIGRADGALAESALAAAALELARQMDGENSATSKAMCAAQLHMIMDKLRELTPKAVEPDGVDELSRRRTARRAGRPASSA